MRGSPIGRCPHTLNYMQASQQGEASMFIANAIEWPTWYGKVNPELAGKVKPIANPRFAGMSSPTGVSSWGFSVSKDSKYKEWNWKFLNYLLKDPNRILLEAGALIPRSRWEKAEGASIIPDPGLISRMQQESFPSGLLKNWAEVSEPIKIAVQSVLFNGKDVKQALDGAKKAVDNALK